MLNRELLTATIAGRGDVLQHQPISEAKIIPEFLPRQLRDNLRLRYGLLLQDIPATCDGCGKKFSIEHALSCPKGSLVFARHDDAAKEWGSLGARALVPSEITYKPKINSRTVQGERTGDGARQEGGEDDGGTETVGRTVNGATKLAGQPGQVVILAESRNDVSAHGFW